MKWENNDNKSITTRLCHKKAKNFHSAHSVDQANSTKQQSVIITSMAADRPDKMLKSARNNTPTTLVASAAKNPPNTHKKWQQAALSSAVNGKKYTALSKKIDLTGRFPKLTLQPNRYANRKSQSNAPYRFHEINSNVPASSMLVHQKPALG